jgi:hypothetical protein
MCCIITDQNDIVINIALTPGLHADVPIKGHLYFPVTEKLPSIGDVFNPDLTLQPWLAP